MFVKNADVGVSKLTVFRITLLFDIFCLFLILLVKIPDTWMGDTLESSYKILQLY